ncbi:hypothetical protein [Ruminiclostridium cellulolyticum]|uniref:Ig domain protein group 2 domain protein n=1 Tax=Ruminiclostridium cellulolyticum (strain ATCC 35319 / DSM 5812 / JCM 6584 / H10) TaxID=394503 RepID=B8I5F6_RUMCH|nr:hypothetical protein [Ruminiclostridium cellulolyticum]ACL76692.1 Ig domain protein group 2 domain protein [Ruminiclostridium cellulolyticum H10]
MYHLKRNRTARIFICMLLVVTLILPAGLATNVANAAAKPSIQSKLTIGAGSIVGNYDYYSKDDKYSLKVANSVNKATYSFTSSNNNIVKVKVSGTTAYLTGVKAGNATITCNQKLNGKTTKVGTCTVTVKNSTVSQDYIPVVPMGTSVSKEVLEFSYRNNDATYTYVSNSKNFTMKEKLSQFDGMYFISQSFTAKAPGTYTVTVKETYNKSTRTVGKIKYTVKKATLSGDSSVDLGSSIWAFELINNYRTDVNYLFVFSDKSIVEESKSGDTIYLKGKKVGKTNVTIYENTKTPDKNKLIGTCKLTVKEVVLEDLDCDFEETELYVGDDPVELEISKDPYNAPGTITVSSSDTKVVTVGKLDEDGICLISPVGVGTATITITCGDITKTQKITVYDEEDY